MGKIRIDQLRIQWLEDDENTMGCQATALVSYICSNQGDRRLETLTSGGLWDIEIDSSPSYLQEIQAEELADLKQHLEQFGVDTTDWPKLLNAVVGGVSA